MHSEDLIKTAQALVDDHKGLLAMDESNPTCHKRFAKYNIPETEEFRRAYREMIVTTPNLSQFISGAILYDETLHQNSKAGKPLIKILMEAGIIPGIKVDMGVKDLPGFPGEKITEGLDGLRERLVEYKKLGARFAKWRAVISIDENSLPSTYGIKANAYTLARYAALCQEAGLVPIVEPEVLMEGNHTLARCAKVTEKTLDVVFNQLYKAGVMLEGILLKPNMILPGLSSTEQTTAGAIADATIHAFLRVVPAAVPGVAFLSGGQSPELASERLNAMNARFKSKLPWAVAFSFSRALQEPALKIWKGQEANVKAAQDALYHRAQCNSAARAGKYSAEMEGK